MQNEACTSRERVRRTIGHEPVDRLAKGELVINDSVVCRELDCEKPGFDEKVGFVDRLGLDIYTVSPVNTHAGKGLPAPESLLWPDMEKWSGETSIFTFAIVDGAFETGMRTYDQLDFLTLPRRSPKELTGFIRRVEELNMSIYREAASKGVDGIIIADDIAYGKGFLTNPQTLREHFFPSLSKQAEEIRRLGLHAFYHSDGYYYQIIPDLIDMGFQGIQCIERNCGMNIQALQREFGKQLCIWGHIETDDTIKAHDPDYLRELKASTEALTPREGLIIGTNCGLYEGMDINGLKLIYKALD